MVFIRDLKREFFDYIIKQQRRIVIFVHLDVDSLCAWKIFQHLLQCEHLTYTCIPVLYKYDLENGYMQHTSSTNKDVKCIVLINCGATLDLYDFLSLTNDAVLFVLDSLRNFDHRNVYDAKQIRLIVLPTKIENEKKRVPDYESLFHEKYDDEEENQENNSDAENDDDNRESFLDDVDQFSEVNQKRLKRQWLKKRDELLFDYYRYHSHSYSSALIMFDLAWVLSKDTNDLLWYAIIGVTEQLLHSRIDRDFYMEQINLLHTHVLRLNHQLYHNSTSNSSSNDDPTNTMKLSMDCFNIKFDEDVNFHLLRHWTLYESIKHSQDMLLLFKLWSSKGQQRLKEFLADLGIPKREYEQYYRDMDVSYKTDLKKQILEKRIQEKYKYTTSTIMLPTFIASSGFSMKLCPQDIVYSTMATLQTANTTSSSSSTMVDLTERFSLALHSLNHQNTTIYLNGIELEKSYLTKTQYLMDTLLQSDKYLLYDNTVPFIQLKFDQNMFNSSANTSTDSASSSCYFFTHPYQTYVFARKVLQTFVCYKSINSKTSTTLRLPLVLVAPFSLTTVGNRTTGDNQELIYIIVGIPQMSTHHSVPGNYFATAFENADQRCGNVGRFVFFDHSVFLLQEQHYQKFIDALTLVLAK